MSATNRERKIIGQIVCPQCGAAIGEPCSVKQGRPMVCRQRKEAWQSWRESRPAELTMEPVEGAVKVRAVTPDARAWLLDVNVGAWNGDYVLVTPDNIVRLTLAANEAGFKIGTN